MIRYEAIARRINLFSTEFSNKRQLFLDIGVPPSRIMTVTAHLIATQRNNELVGIPSDYDARDNLPDVLKK